MSHQILLEQPVIACLGETRNFDFPLILIVGREYNNIGKIVNKIGTYSFTESPRSTFWNRAYTFVSRCYGNPIKQSCINRNASPVIFSNALPIPIQNNVPKRKKDELRSQVPENKIISYIDDIFRQPILERVEAAVLSGIENQAIFGRATNRIITKCNETNIINLLVPYFADPRQTTEAIDRSIGGEDRGRIKEIVEAFLMSTDPSRV